MTSEPAIPSYVGTSGQIYCPPFLMEQTRLYAFIVQADQDYLQRNVCDRFFNVPSQGEEQFDAVAPYVMITFSNIPAIRSQTAPYNRYGYFPEKEIGFWVLMWDANRKKLCWTIPYIFVDCSVAIAAGREIYGFPKQSGELLVPPDPAQADVLNAQALLVETYDPSSPGQVAQIVKAYRTGTTPSDLNGDAALSQILSFPHILTAIMNVLSAQGNLLADVGDALEALCDDALNNAEDMAIPLVFLKQFRDCNSDNLVCYQSIVETPLTALKSYSMGWLPPYEITVNSYDSQPFQLELGLQPGPMQPVLGFTTESDNVFGIGAELWKWKG